MKVIQSFLFSIVILICAANSCDPNEDGHWDGRLTIVNNSNDTIISFLQYNFPDTILLDENAPELNNIIITPNSLGKHYSSIKWEDHISSLNTHKSRICKSIILNVENCANLTFSSIPFLSSILSQIAL